MKRPFLFPTTHHQLSVFLSSRGAFDSFRNYVIVALCTFDPYRARKTRRTLLPNIFPNMSSSRTWRACTTVMSVNCEMSSASLLISFSYTQLTFFPFCSPHLGTWLQRYSVHRGLLDISTSNADRSTDRPWLWCKSLMVPICDLLTLTHHSR